MLRILLMVVVCGVFVGCAEEKAGGGGFVYEVSREGESFYLGATMHVLRKRDRPADSAYMEVLEKSERLVCETDGSENRSVVLGAMSGAGPVADSVLDEGQRRRVSEILHSAGMDPALGAQVPPHVLAMMIVFRGYGEIGASPEYGMDRRLRGRARKWGIPILGLETGLEQGRIFGEMPESMKLAMLLELLPEAGLLGEQGRELFDSWTRGSEERFGERLFDGMERMPALMERVHGVRNRLWVPKIESLVADGVVTFVAVGGAHLFGEQGLLVLFRERGWLVKRIDRNGLLEAGDGA